MIYTSGGEYFHFDRMNTASVTIEAIAHALGNLCRFTGHVREFYSVAEHSVHCSHLVPEEFALEALLHDGHEALVGDMASPLKWQLPHYAMIEEEVERSLRYDFGLPLKMSPEVKLADMMMLRHEKVHALGCSDEWPVLDGVPETDKVELRFWTPSEARAAFMTRFNEITTRNISQ